LSGAGLTLRLWHRFDGSPDNLGAVRPEIQPQGNDRCDDVVQFVAEQERRRVHDPEQLDDQRGAAEELHDDAGDGPRDHVVLQRQQSQGESHHDSEKGTEDCGVDRHPQAGHQ
jgi:hypothetical protein